MRKPRIVDNDKQKNFVIIGIAKEEIPQEIFHFKTKIFKSNVQKSNKTSTKPTDLISQNQTPIPQKPPPMLAPPKTEGMGQQLLRTDKSLDNPNVELARILSVWDMVMIELNWDDCKFSAIIRDAQASVDGKYHNDIKDVIIAQEIESRDEKKGANKPAIGLKILQ